MRCSLALLLFVVGPTVPAQPDLPEDRARWLHLAVNCVLSGEAQMIASDESGGVYAFACSDGGERFVFMLNLSDERSSVERTGEVEPLVPIFSSSGDVSAIPSLVIELLGDGTVIHSNPIPPHTVVVFRPIRQRDIRPYGLDE
jgi:hypothetical protein